MQTRQSAGALSVARKSLCTGWDFQLYFPDVAGEVGDGRRTSINDVEHERHAQLTLAWIEASECPYRDMRKGACQKRDDYAL